MILPSLGAPSRISSTRSLEPRLVRKEAEARRSLTRLGGLTGIGIFLMRWRAGECLLKFNGIVQETFGRRKSLPALLSHVQTLLLMCLDEGKYHSMAIRSAFQSSLGPPPKMFNPLATDTKVAVITAPVDDKVTSIICNYNGEDRPGSEEIGKRI